MLVLSRRRGEEVVIDESIRVSIIAVKGGCVRIGIAAPSSVTVDREEIHERRTDAGRKFGHPCRFAAPPNDYLL